jgi:alpha-tubulin suppressor-like RCC1 family protein
VQVDLTPLNGSKVVIVSARHNHSLALDNQGRLWAWGNNQYGQLGDGSTTRRLSPVQVDLTSLNGSTVVAVSAGGFYSLVLDDQGRLWAWGRNDRGQLGDGSDTNRLSPVQVDMSMMKNSKVKETGMKKHFLFR